MDGPAQTSLGVHRFHQPAVVRHDRRIVGRRPVVSRISRCMIHTPMSWSHAELANRLWPAKSPQPALGFRQANEIGARASVWRLTSLRGVAKHDQSRLNVYVRMRGAGRSRWPCVAFAGGRGTVGRTAARRLAQCRAGVSCVAGEDHERGSAGDHMEQEFFGV